MYLTRGGSPECSYMHVYVCVVKVSFCSLQSLVLHLFSRVELRTESKSCLSVHCFDACRAAGVKGVHPAPLGLGWGEGSWGKLPRLCPLPLNNLPPHQWACAVLLNYACLILMTSIFFFLFQFFGDIMIFRSFIRKVGSGKFPHHIVTIFYLLAIARVDTTDRLKLAKSWWGTASYCICVFGAVYIAIHDTFNLKFYSASLVSTSTLLNLDRWWMAGLILSHPAVG